MRDFAGEFERRARDAGMAEEDAKVLLVGSLNKHTLSLLDTFLTTRDPAYGGQKETTQERLQRTPYSSMLSFLKRSNLADLAGSNTTRMAF